MSTKTSMTAWVEDRDRYAVLEKLVADRIAQATGPLFTTDADPETLWYEYLHSIPDDTRQTYCCNCCRRFIQKYGGLVAMDETGAISPLLWVVDPAKVPPRFLKSMEALHKTVSRAHVNGVWVSSETVWGTPVTGEWTHLSGNPNPKLVYDSRALTAEQTAAEKREDRRILAEGLSRYSEAVLGEAVRVLEADALDRSEKTLGVARWLFVLKHTLRSLHGRERAHNLLWRAAATAPPGWCHINSTMIHTLLDDILAGMDYEVVAERWARKMHPLKYQRPQAPPSLGNIQQAEKLFEKLGAAKALERRYAKLSDIPAHAFIWVPPGLVVEEDKGEDGKPKVFGHLVKDAMKKGSSGGGVLLVKPLQLPPRATSWLKVKDLLKEANSVEVLTRTRGSYYGLATAVHEDAPAILQWDNAVEGKRAPVSWYFYANGATAEQFNLKPHQWVKVNAVFPGPHEWYSEHYSPGMFDHITPMVFFALDGARDVSDYPNSPGAAIFPESLKSEFHAVRSVIEAHSTATKLLGGEEGNANGIAITKAGLGQNVHHMGQGWDSKVVVRLNQRDVWLIERWD